MGVGVENAATDVTTANPDQGIHAQFQLQYPGTELSTFALDVNLVLPANGITAIIGQSGSGKTTLLRCVAGLERATRGQMVVNGETWQSETLFIPTHQRSLGYVFQESSLFPHLTAQGNLNYAVKRSGAANSTRLYDQVTELMGIDSALSRYPSQLSGGERQRIAIARALLIQPRLLLMDEPLASLDMARKLEILPYLEKLRVTFNIPILYVSHAMDEVAHLADHAVLLQHGNVKAQGSVEEVFSRVDLPSLTGDNIGVIWDGKVAQRDMQWHLVRVDCVADGLWLPDSGHRVGERVRTRIMARDVSLALSCHTDSSILNRLPVEIEEITATSDDTQALVRLKAGSKHLIAQLTWRSVDYLKLVPGLHLWAQIKSVAVIC